ncbi:MAG TPA: hypothetical protein VGI39_37960, partial [Polyangiaceae bacterium]
MRHLLRHGLLAAASLTLLATATECALAPAGGPEDSNGDDTQPTSKSVAAASMCVPVSRARV